MKLSLLFAALILIAASFFGWRDHRQLSSARVDHARLVEEAQALGLEAGDPGKDGKRSSQSRGKRDGKPDREAQVKAFAAKLAAFANEMKAMEKSGVQPDEEMQKRIFAIMEEMLALDAAQLKILVAELRVAPGLDGEMRSGIVGFAIMSLANDHPASALALFTESSDLFKNDGMSGHVVTAALSRWSQDDPMAALEWIRKNSKDHPDLASDPTKRGVLTGAARQDPKLAFALITELGLEKDGMVGNSIVESAATPAERIAVLAALREHLKTMSDPEARAQLLSSTMASLGQKAAAEGFDSAVAWFESSATDKEELTAFADSLNPWTTKADTGKWLDWMADKLPPERISSKVDNLVREWTRDDYKAAGVWLNDSEEGPVKEAAVLSFAKTVAPYEPASAAQWALTLPEGKERESLLREVRDQWKKKDEAAAADFTRENGIPE